MAKVVTEKLTLKFKKRKMKDRVREREREREERVGWYGCYSSWVGRKRGLEGGNCYSTLDLAGW